MNKITSNDPTSNIAITLVALVITIIVLLILAGVTLSMIMGENGIINKAQLAKEKTETANKDEEDKLNKLDNEMDSYVNGNTGIKDENSNNNLNKVLEEMGISLIFYDGNYYNTDKFEVNIFSEELQEDKTILVAPKKDLSGYGVYVKGKSFTGRVYFKYSMLLYDTDKGFYGTGQVGNGNENGILPDMDTYGTNRTSFTNLSNLDTDAHIVYTSINSSSNTAYIAEHNGNSMRIEMIYAIKD